MLSQTGWHDHWSGLTHVVIDEVHALVPTKRGADLSVSIERLADRAGRDPCRVGLSATCRPAEPVARFLVGVGRECRVLDAEAEPVGLDPAPPIELEVESLINDDEAPDRSLTYRRLLRRVTREIEPEPDDGRLRQYASLDREADPRPETRPPAI